MTREGRLKIDDVDAFLSKARDEYEVWRKVDAEDREAGEDDNKFAYADDKNLDQWDKRAKKARTKRPILQWNRIPTYTQRIANESRKNKPSIKISPGDEIATKATAEYLQARIRYIEYESNVDTARDTTGKQQVVTGRAFMRVSTEWIPGTSKQRIVVDAVPNQFSVVWVGGEKYDRTDADACYVIRFMTREQHTRKYGKDATERALDFASDNLGNGWVNVGDTGEMIQVADYWHKTWKTVTAEDGRKEQVATIQSCVIDGAQILKEIEPWLGSTIPIVPVWGEEAIVDGVRRTFSLIRNVKTPQRDLNLAISTLAEKVGQIPKSPYLIPLGGVAPEHEADWKDAHNTALMALYYKQYDDENRPLNKPEFNQQEPPIQAVLEWMHECVEGIKAGLGIFDAALGAKSNEQSGVAIERRKVQGELTNLHFPDNQARSNKYLGEILVELIMRMEREGSYPIRTEDHKTHVVPMGVEHPDWKTGEPVTHDLASGQYGVFVSQGPSYDTQRQESQQRDIELVQANPEMLYAIGPSMLRADDAPGADQRADAWEQYVSLKIPGMKFQRPGQTPGAPDPHQLQQQLEKVTQELQQTHQFAQSLHQKIESKTLELQQQTEVELKKLDFQYAKLKVDDENAKLTIAQKEGIAELEQQIAVLESRMDRAHEMAKLQAGQQHAAEMQDGQQDHDAAQAEATRQAAADSQTQAQEHTSAEAEANRQAAAEQPQGEQ